MDKTQKNKGSQPPDGGSGASYDYSHLRERDKKKHWYNTPQSHASGQVNPSSHVGTPAENVPSPPTSPSPPMNLNIAATLPANKTVAIPPAKVGDSDKLKRGKVRHRIDTRRKRKMAGMPENWAWVVIASALLGLTIIGSMFMVFIIRYAMQDSNDAIALSPEIEPTSIVFSGNGEEAVGGALENSLQIEDRKWDGQERFTILLMGLDKRPDENNTTAFRSDVMILISLDPRDNTIGVLSIPRDTYVEVPYGGLHRVNVPYFLGELESPGGGPRLAMQTVQYNFGMRVNDYVTVDFQTVIGIVDAIGGIDVEVQKNIIDYEYPTWDYGTEVFQLEAGWHHLDGETALKFARTRHATDDIDRQRRQQQVMFAIRDRITGLDMLDDLVFQAPQLYTSLNDGINTGLSLDQLISLAVWAKDVPRENIHTGVVSWEYLLGYTTETGANVLVPDRYSIGQLMVEVFGEDYNQ